MSQEIKTPKKKVPFKIPLRVYLGYLLILTLVFTAVSFAKFATSGSASDSARVASFAVSASASGDKTVEFDDYATKFNTSKLAEYDISVFNSRDGEVSEVAISYDVVVTVPKASIKNSDDLDMFSLLLDDSTSPAVTANGTNFVYTFSNVGVFPAAVESEKTHKLKITADSDKITSDLTNIEFTVSVTFTQID